MKKIIIFLTLFIVCSNSYSQTTKNKKFPTQVLSDLEYDKEHKNVIDSLSKVYNKPVDGFLQTISNDTVYTTIFYKVDKKLFSLGPFATPHNSPNSTPNRAVNVNRQ